MKKLIFTLILLIFTCSVTLFSKKREDVPQKPERMEQREKTTELNYFENPRYQNKPKYFIAEDGNYIYHEDLYVNEYTTPNKFNMIQKLYYKDGSLKSKMTYSLFSCIKSEEWDENGFLIEKEEYELKKDIDGMDYASFFEKEGWYDRKTGQTAFREEPYPLNTGEFTDMVNRRIKYDYKFVGMVEDPNDSTINITITNIKKVPQQFLDKYGTIGEDGVKYLERRNNTSDGCELHVFYIIDSNTGTYKVDWAYILYIE